MTVQPGPLLSDALISSPVIVGEDGAGAVPGGYEFGVDPNEDPELALVLFRIIFLFIKYSIISSICPSPSL